MYLVYVLVLFTFQNRFLLNNSVYVSMIYFLSSVGMRCFYRDNLSIWGSGVLWGPCFCCAVSCGLYPPWLTWCVVITYSYIFGAWYPPFLPNRSPYMLGLSVLFGDWLSYPDVVWAPPWSLGALMFFLPLFLFMRSFSISTILRLLPCAPNRSGPCISFYFCLTSNLSMSSTSYFCLSFSTISAILWNVDCLSISFHLVFFQWSEPLTLYTPMQWG